MRVGETLHLIMRKDEVDDEVNLRCNIIGLDESSLFIDYPINEDTSTTEFIPNGTILTAIYIDSDNVPLHFPTKVTHRIKLTVPVLAINIPVEEEIKRIQRREFVRVKTAIDIAVHSDMKEFTPFSTITFDLSGGGISVLLPKGISLAEKSKLLLWMVLPNKTEGNEYLKIKGEMIRERETEVESKIKKASIRFISLPRTEQQKIVRFCFEKQLEARAKERNL